jgi:hypothetical protein
MFAGDAWNVNGFAPAPVFDTSMWSHFGLQQAMRFFDRINSMAGMNFIIGPAPLYLCR